MELEDKGLSIGGYKSAWLVDLAIAYLFDRSKDELKQLIFKRIYRDDGIGVMDRQYSVDEMSEWLKKFQQHTNKLCDNQHLIWTISIWDPETTGSTTSSTNAKIDIIRKNMFPFLDMKISWDCWNISRWVLT